MAIRVINSVNLTLLQEFKDLPFHIQRVPTNAVRPSIFIELLPSRTEESSRQSYIDYMTVAIFYLAPFTEDEYFIQDMTEQLSILKRLKKPFLKGFLDIEGTDRKAKITDIRTGFQEFEVYIELDLYISDLDTLPDYSLYDKDGNLYPIMDELQLKLKVEK